NHCQFLLLCVYIFIHSFFFLYFYNTDTTVISTLSLHDALPICSLWICHHIGTVKLHQVRFYEKPSLAASGTADHKNILVSCICRSEEHTSELQSRFDLVCRLLLEKIKQIINNHSIKLKHLIKTI